MNEAPRKSIELPGCGELDKAQTSGWYTAGTSVPFPAPVQADSQTGTVQYTLAHPTVFLKNASGQWLFEAAGDNSRWQEKKTIYDPCPAGWRVPSSSVWNRAGIVDQSTVTVPPDAFGFRLSKAWCDSYSWSPLNGRLSTMGTLDLVNQAGVFWMASTPSYNAEKKGVYGYQRTAEQTVTLFTTASDYEAYGQSVRCQKE